MLTAFAQLGHAKKSKDFRGHYEAGVKLYEASDYAQARGLRAPKGRLRAAEKAVRDAIRQLRESITG